MSRAKTMMDALEGSSSESESDDETGGPAAASDAQEDKEQQPQPKRAKKQGITLEDLEATGYKAPSILDMKPPKEEIPVDWRWSDGRDKADEEAEESFEERERNRAVATSAAEQSAFYAVKAMERAAQAREEAKAQREQKAADKKLTFNQKEKRKRDAGQQSRGKNYVEEEKRLARTHGVYSGFD